MGTQANILQTQWHTFSSAGQQLSYRVVDIERATPTTRLMPLVLIHGFGVSSYIWQWTLPHLVIRHPVLLADLPGHGRSTYVSPWQLRSIAPLLAQWLRSLHVPPVALMGQSMGGAIAIHLAASAPELVSRLILVSAAGVPLQSTIPHLVSRAFHSFFQRGNGNYPIELLHDILRPRPRVFWQAMHEVARSDFQHELASITQPTLIIWGERDVLLPITLGHTLQAALPHAQFVTLPHCGHRPMLAEPALFSKIVLDFLHENDS